MRKNSPRKWLHAVLDLLPVILIPVFMIYSHRHTIDSGSITIQEKIGVDFNQINNFQYRSLTNVGVSGVPTQDGEGIEFTGTNTNVGVRAQWFFTTTLYISIEPTHVYYVKPFFTGHEFSDMELWGGARLNQGYATYSKLPYRFNGFDEVGIYLQNFGQVHDYDFIVYCNIFDLTQMFGSGNEPTNEQFDALFSNGYYPYVVSQKMLIDKPTLTTFDDTDIMSQFTYQLYNSVDKYFNMGNVFNLNGVYDWFNLNIFNGTAPLYVYIVWQIVLYEFVMDLLFLLYGLFMWFIDMVQHLMDKPFKSIK